MCTWLPHLVITWLGGSSLWRFSSRKSPHNGVLVRSVVLLWLVAQWSERGGICELLCNTATRAVVFPCETFQCNLYKQVGQWARSGLIVCRGTTLLRRAVRGRWIVKCQIFEFLQREEEAGRRGGRLLSLQKPPHQALGCSGLSWCIPVCMFRHLLVKESEYSGHSDRIREVFMMFIVLEMKRPLYTHTAEYIHR